MNKELIWENRECYLVHIPFYESVFQIGNGLLDFLNENRIFYLTYFERSQNKFRLNKDFFQ